MNTARECSKGVPVLPTNNPFFKCPFCKKAKTLKKGGKQKDEDTFIPEKVYHMDIQFINGPVNLEDVYASIDKPKLMVKQSRDGYIGFLNIINVATRQIWIHLIKNKDPLTLYIDNFLKQYRIR